MFGISSECCVLDLAVSQEQLIANSDIFNGFLLSAQQVCIFKYIFYTAGAHSHTHILHSRYAFSHTYFIQQVRILTHIIYSVGTHSHTHILHSRYAFSHTYFTQQVRILTHIFYTTGTHSHTHILNSRYP